MRLDSIPTGTVVVGLDGSTDSDGALRWAVEEAQARHRDLTLVHAAALPRLGDVGDSAIYYEAMRREAREEGHRITGLAREVAEELAPDVEVREVVVEGDPRDVLIELSQRAATLVVGSRGRGPVRSLLLGSVGVAVVRHGRSTVVVHRPGSDEPGREGVVVGVDGTSRSMTVLEHAFEAASFRRQPLTVVHCRWIGPLGDSLEEQELRLAETVAGMGEKYPDVHVVRVALDGPPEQRLVDEASRALLLVVGGHAGGLASELLTGSVATSVVEHARCAVEVVPAGEG